MLLLSISNGEIVRNQPNKNNYCSSVGGDVATVLYLCRLPMALTSTNRLPGGAVV